ncbi:hypothetical protein IC757_16405 [Wenzhouxiangella sp. AB-CW3]|uniref:hypothetical protein n=1 Tax=Wenzhouxiangella sp. AB-CW3 TaxID=2771012 RepID=UPI00168AF385|nr:hypothetical protein [Wenzhouxiangella sp. AB-CW3]QOC22561.1 hypothetical protein IC757_16395 [Wenzhouxiangella sp. AB-CW3]QOC22563.1 hypothetical protein IC757_16405 [Wenzhouxiangella sp. AB-CW3]
MNKYCIGITVAVLLSGTLLADELSLEELRERSRDCALFDDEGSYSGDALGILWGDFDIVFDCAPPGRSEKQRFSIYVVINENGEVSQATVVPESEAAQCIEEKARSRVFPKPPFADYVLGVSVNL